MQRENFYLDNDDLQFHVNKKLDFQKLFAWMPKEHLELLGGENFEEHRNNWLQVVEAFGEICADISTRSWQMEQEDIQLVNQEVEFPSSIRQNMSILREFGVAGFSIHPKYSGMGAPFVFDMIGAEMLNRACPSTMLNSAWYGPIAHVIEEFASEELKNLYIPQIASGEISGNMALTEPDAGSDLNALRSYVEAQGDGTYKIFGTKRFISNGNSEISLVLAKTHKGAVGLDRLSLFLCPRHLNQKLNYTIVSLEKKIGLHGSATCELAFDGATAWLIGEENKGYQYMLKLMNDSRIGVGFQGIGLMEAIFRETKNYTSSRKSWGRPIAEHELVCEKLLDMEITLKGLRSLSLKTAMFHSLEILGKEYLKTAPVEERKKVQKDLSFYEKKVRELTPLIKYFTGEQSFLMARTGYQLHGGYGFTKEYKIEWLLRESLIYSVYEGTSQMQALMCVKDTFKAIMKQPQAFVQDLLSFGYHKLLETDSLERKLYQLKYIFSRSSLSILFKLIQANLNISLKTSSKTDLFKMAKLLKNEFKKFENLTPALSHAERLCEIKCLVVIAETLVEDAKLDTNREWMAKRFCHTALQKAKCLQNQIENEDQVLKSTLEKYEKISLFVKSDSKVSSQEQVQHH